MEKNRLITDLEKIINCSTLSVDLFFVFKHGEIYKHFLSDPDQSLRDKLIKEFVSILRGFTNPTNLYQLNNIYDDNEYEDYHLFYDNLNENEIAKSIFNFERTNALPYFKEVGPMSKIYGFLIEISNGLENLTIYKRNQPTNAINPQNVINFFTGTDNKIQLFQQNAIYINKQIDVFKISDTIFINNRSVYETHFGFTAELKAKAEMGFTELLAFRSFDFSDKLQDKVKNFSKEELKKLSSLTRNNPILETKNWDAILFQARNYAKHNFETNADGSIKIKTQKELKLLISILNRDFNLNEASQEKFLTKNKKQIK
jgi:hypothetical protein